VVFLSKKTDFYERAILSMQLQRAKARYELARNEAYRLTEADLRPVIGISFSVSDWAARSANAYAGQWSSDRHPDASWNWPEIFRKYSDPDRLPIVIWVDSRLCCLALGITTGEAIILKFLEREFSATCPLVGRCALIALDVAARYAQARGRSELRVFPVNSSLETLYRDIYRFTLMTPDKTEPYYRKAV
jgi:hypothetical protein